MENEKEAKKRIKEEQIAQERDKLAKLLTKLDPKAKKSVGSLIDEAAFMAVSLRELRETINKKGYTEEYKNGANQFGIKKCSEVEIYIQLSKNYMSAIKQLTDLLPKGEKITEVDDGFEDFVNGR